MASEPELSELFRFSRFPSGPSVLLCVLYAPIGLLLALFRVFFSLQLFVFLSVLPKGSLIKRMLLKVSGAIMGFVVTKEGENLSGEKPKVIVSNHATAVDHLAIEALIPHTMHTSMVRCPQLVQWLLGYSDFGGPKERENIDNKIRAFLTESATPLLIFPEEVTTNTATGLLKFHPWAFELSDTVVPMVISVSRMPFPWISPSVLHSGWWTDLFWTVFVPYTNFHIRVLPPVSRAEQTPEEFSMKVQGIMATAGNLKATKFTAEDKARYSKKVEQEAQERAWAQEAANGAAGSSPRGASRATPGVDSSPNRNTRLSRLVEQVKEVLPQVPDSAIRRDLSRTHCVDQTITNILEGRVKYVPEALAQQNTATPKVTESPKTNSSPFSPGNRQKTLEERKQMMFENARKKYKEKYGT